jgi:hypothetical protein
VPGCRGHFVARGWGPWASRGAGDATLIPPDVTPGPAVGGPGFQRWRAHASARARGAVYLLLRSGNPTAVDPEGDRLEHDSYRAAGLGLNSLYVAAGRSRVDGGAAARRGRCGVDAAVPSAWAVYSRHSHSENSIALEYGRLPVSRREKSR